MPNKIFVEIEGVIADASHRTHYRRDRDQYDALADEDSPIDDVIEFLEILNQTFVICLFSTRSELSRMALEQWLMDCNVQCDELLLRPENDYTPAVQLKRQMILDYFDGRDDLMEEDTFAIISNHEQTVEMFREEQFRVLTTDWQQ